MRSFPDFLEPYRAAGQNLVARNAIKGLVFSGPTYQVEVDDPERTLPLWVFLQFDEEETIKDLFCSCEESSEKGACAHMAASCFWVYHNTTRPLHVLFRESFFHHLFLRLQEELTTQAPKVTQNSVATSEGKILFQISGKGENYRSFLKLLEPKPEETEETSIKFSSLTDEELERFRTGRPSLGLRYELSFLSDIAKWLFLKEATVRLSVPDRVEIECEGLLLNLQIDLMPLIPTLNTVKANLSLLDENLFFLEKIDFDPKQGIFTLYTAPKEYSFVEYGDYHFLPGLGFLPKDKKPLKKRLLKDKEDIIRLLNEALPEVKKHLTVPIEELPQELSYSLSFDAKNRLHIDGYYKTPRDLDKALSFDGWVFVKDRFIKLAPRKFEKLSFDVPQNEMSAFLMAHKQWLSCFKGFHVHVAKLEEQILYEIDAYGNLTFRSVLQKLPETKKCRDLGDWLYVDTEGFYIKNFSEENPPFPLGKEIPKHLVAEYIRHTMDLLQQVPGFFAETNPIKSVGLEIKLKKRGVIDILPKYEWKKKQYATQCLFYDEFVYVHEEGFYRLPLELRPVHLMREISSEDPESWQDFFQNLLPKLKEEYPTTVDPRLEMAEDLALTVTPQEKEGGDPSRLSDWALDVFWQGHKGTIAMKDVVQAKKREERFLPTEAGVIDLSEDRYRWLDSVKEREKSLSLQPSDFLRVMAYDTIHVDTKGIQSRETFRAILERLLEQKPTSPVELSSLACELRSYQKHGVEWLWFLYQNSLSGLLCDDMGVGKTHQAMGLMDSVRNLLRKRDKKALFLVVCPTSLVYHWQDKVSRYLPDFKIKAYVGTNRSLDDFEGDYDLLLVSYGIWRNESQKLKKYFFDAAFFDELQIAKNHVSQIHTALLSVHASLKVGLTGTPIENQLRELKALFDLVMPGYMPVEADFREFFMRPIERGDNPKRKEILSRYVRPFVLRRRKRDVLPDLPEKSEELSFNELAPEQKSLYRTVASQQALPLIRQLQDESASIPYMHIFAVLSALKQICNHPAAYLKDVANYESYESGKWEAFVELIEEAMESEQKVVVFSQYLAMLDIMELFLQKNGIGYAQIRGQTKNRGDEVGRFHSDPNCKVFLGSLQAAGLGIDLTPASVVIHYDRWWNAARENQATDRVHRIGQTRGVQVFKLLTKSTIEERIDQLISNKANLLEDVVFFDDHQVVKRLSRKEIISLLEGLPED